MGQLNQRLVFRNAYKAMQRAGVNPAQAVLSQSYLRLERVAATGVTNYQFGVLVNDQPGGSTIRQSENRLNLQDSFFVSSIQLFVYNTTNATDTDAVFRTYPNPRVFSTAGASAALYQLYNGVLSLTVNNRVITPSWDLARHLVVPQTQQTVTPVATTIPLDQIEGGTYGEYACEPNWVLIGSKNNNLTINLPNAISTLQASSTTVICMMLRGVLAQNSTQVS
jgi:hypothetical protein